MTTARPKKAAAKDMTIRSDMDRDDMDQMGRRLDGFLRELRKVDPGMSELQARIANPDLPRFDLRHTSHGLDLWMHPTDKTRSYHVQDEGLRQDQQILVAGDALKIVDRWRRRLRLPVYRPWAGRDVRSDPYHQHAARVAMFAEAARPGLKNAWATVVPPTHASPGTVFVTNPTDAGMRRLVFDEALEAHILATIPPCISVDAAMSGNYGIRFSAKADEVSSMVDGRIDAIERLRAMATIERVCGKRKAVKNA